MDRDLKDNDWSVTIPPVISKIFKKLLCKQIVMGYAAQDSLLAMLEHWKSVVDKGKIFEALLIDLSKAFHCLSQELLIAKVNIYGFNLVALKLVQSDLSKRQRRTKINQTYSSWDKMFSGVLQGSILGPFLFNIFLKDIFFVAKDVNFASYTDDNTVFQWGRNVDEIINDLQFSLEKLFRWFSDNQMKGNID